MGVCPKCNKKLPLLSLGQQCPYCGVNMRFYGFEERFYSDAKKAELSMANVHIKIRKFKRAFIGNRLALFRLLVFLLPLLSMLLPTLNVVINFPFKEEKIAVSALGIYGIFTNGTLNFINEMTASQFFGEAFSALRMSLFLFAGAAVCAFFVLLCTILCFISIKNMARILCSLSVAGAALSVASTLVGNGFCKTAAALSVPLFSGNAALGSIVTVAMFMIVFVLNFLVAKKGLPVEYEEGDLERCEIAKKVKKGEIKLEDLPQPICQTAETRKIDEEIRREKENYIAAHKEKGEALVNEKD